MAWFLLRGLVYVTMIGIYSKYNCFFILEHKLNSLTRTQMTARGGAPQGMEGSDSARMADGTGGSEPAVQKGSQGQPQACFHFVAPAEMTFAKLPRLGV